jgi:hypothetical protein
VSIATSATPAGVRSRNGLKSCGKRQESVPRAGVEFAGTMKTSQGETVTFEIGEDDPQYERVAGLLKSLGAERVRDFSITVPTLREFVRKMVAGGGERLKQEAAMQAQWEPGREVLRQSVELLKSGKKEEARKLLDPAIAEAIHFNHSSWALVLCRHAAVISRIMGDREHQIKYEEQALPFPPDRSFAAYNFAQLLLSDRPASSRRTLRSGGI